MANERKLRILIDSTGAKKGSKEVTNSIGKVVSSGKKAVDIFKELNKTLNSMGIVTSTTKKVQKAVEDQTKAYQELGKNVSKNNVAQKEQAALNQRLATSFEKLALSESTEFKQLVKNQEALRKQKKAIKEEATALSESEKQAEANTRAHKKLENTLRNEQARYEALQSEVGKTSVEIQEERRIIEELARSKQRLAKINSQEYKDLIKTRQAIEQRTKELRNFGKENKKATKSVSELGGAFSALTTATAGLAGYFSVLGITRIADDYTNLTNKLAAVTQGTVDVTSSTRDLLEVSVDARSTLEGTMDIYSKMTRLNETLGKSQQEVASVTEAVSKAVAMSGASIQGAQGAVMQFSQAMSANWQTSAQELNSILEQTPALAYYMVQGLREVTGETELTSGTLKKFAEEGKLSSEIVFEAFMRVLPRIREDFENTQQTVASAGSNLVDSLTVAIGEIDKSLGISKSITASIKELTQSLPDLKDEIVQLTVAATALVSTVALGGLVAIMGTIAGPILAVSAAVSLLAGWIAKSYMESTKYERALGGLNSELKDLTDSTDKFNDSLNVMSSSQLVNTMASVQSSIKLTRQEMQELNTEIEARRVASQVQRSSELFMKEGLAASLKPFTGKDEGVSEEMQEMLDLVDAYEKKLNILEARLGSTKEALDAAYSREALSRLEDFKNFHSDLTDNVSSQNSAWVQYVNTLVEIKKRYDEATAAAKKAGDTQSQSQIEALKDSSEWLARLKLEDSLPSVEDLLEKQIEMVNPLEEINNQYEDMQENLDKVTKSQIRMYDELFKRGDIDIDQRDELIKKVKQQKVETEKLMQASKDREVFAHMTDNITDAANSFKQLADTVGEGSKEMEVVINALAAAQAIYAVLNQASGDPYTAFARMAAMAAAVASLGVSIGGLSNFEDESAANQAVQGTGTVLGDSEAKSESIANAVEYSADALEQIVGINTNMLNALENLANAIEGAATLIARDVETPTVSPGKLYSNPGRELTGMIPGLDTVIDTYIKVFDSFTFGLGSMMSGLVSKFIGGSSKVTDEGIKIIGGTLEDIINNTTALAFQSIKYKKHALSSTKRKTKFKAVDESVEAQFDLVFQSIFDSVRDSALSLGMDKNELDTLLESYVIEPFRISLKDLNSEEQIKELNAVFSKVFDEMAGAIVPVLRDLQKAGEGLGETLSRVATNFQVTNAIIDQIGLTYIDQGLEQNLKLSEYIINALGEASEAATALTGFMSGFASSERNLQVLRQGLTKSLGEQGIELKSSRDLMYQYTQTLDISNQKDADRLILILELQDKLDEYYNSLEENASRIQQQQNLLNSYTDRVLSAFTKLINDIVDGIEEERDTALDDLKAQYEKDKQDLEDYYDNLIDSLNKTTDAQIESNQELVDSLNESISELQNLISSVRSAADMLQGTFIEETINQQQAMSILQRYLTTGNREGVADAANIAATISPENFNTSGDYRFEQAKALYTLRQVEAKAVNELTYEEESLLKLNQIVKELNDSKKSQLDQLKDNRDTALQALEKQYQLDQDKLNQMYDAQVDFYQSTLEFYQQELDTFRNMQISFDNFSEGVEAVLDAIGGERSGTSGKTNKEIIDAVYAIIGKNTKDGKTNWKVADREIGEYAINENISFAELAAALEKPVEYINKIWENTQKDTRVDAVTGRSDPVVENPYGGESVSDSDIVTAVNEIVAKNTNQGITNWDNVDRQVIEKAIRYGVSSDRLASLVNRSKQYILDRADQFNLPRFKDGGLHKGGWAMVGDKMGINNPNAELIHTPSSANIYTQQQAKNLIDVSGVIEELRVLRKEVVNLRAETKAVAANTKGTYKTLDRWDAEGQPEVREWTL